ncbi:MAG: hypothetical protein ACI9YH_000150 [Colwellia sp.]|jgi:hypothetical protein
MNHFIKNILTTVTVIGLGVFTLSLAGHQKFISFDEPKVTANTESDSSKHDDTKKTPDLNIKVDDFSDSEKTSDTDATPAVTTETQVDKPQDNLLAQASPENVEKYIKERKRFKSSSSSGLLKSGVSVKEVGSRVNNAETLALLRSIKRN